MERQKYTQNFYYDEFECQCGCGVGIMSPMFMERLQHLRVFYDKPIAITSGVRCLAHNSAVGGSPKSRHLVGNAADLAIDNAADRYRIAQLALKLGFGGIGIGSSFVHLDLRSSLPVLWTYS